MFFVLALLAAAGAVVAVSGSSSGSGTEDGFRLDPSIFGHKLKRVEPPPSGLVLSPSGVPLVWSDSDYAPASGHKAMDATAQLWASVWVSDPAPPGYRACNSWEKQQDFLHGGIGLDAGGRCWPGDLPGHWEWVHGTDEKGWQEVAFEVAQTVFTIALTAAATAATVEIGGIGGVAAATALTAVKNLANGATLTDAVVSAAAATAKSEFQKSTFFATYQEVANGYADAKSGVAWTTAQLDQLKNNRVLAAPTTKKNEANEAVSAAIAIAQAREAQVLAIEEFKNHLGTDEERRWLMECIARGTDLDTWAFALYGDPGAQLAAQIRADKIAKITAGQA